LPRRIADVRQLPVYRWLARPRNILTWGLFQINPAPAHNLVSNDEMDARFDRVYNQLRRALHCPDQTESRVLHGLAS
jgi:hypothetical protein